MFDLAVQCPMSFLHFNDVQYLLKVAGWGRSRAFSWAALSWSDPASSAHCGQQRTSWWPNTSQSNVRGTSVCVCVSSQKSRLMTPMMIFSQPFGTNKKKYYKALQPCILRLYFFFCSLLFLFSRIGHIHSCNPNAFWELHYLMLECGPVSNLLMHVYKAGQLKSLCLAQFSTVFRWFEFLLLFW